MNAKWVAHINIFHSGIKNLFLFILLFFVLLIFHKTFADEGDNKNKLNKIQLKQAKLIYKNNCAKCHGKRAKGNSIVPGFTDKQLDYYYTIQTVVGGRRKMPAFGNTLNNSEIALVVAYLKTLNNNDFDTIIVKKNVIGKYRLLYNNDSTATNLNQEIVFNANNTFTFIDNIENKKIEGLYYIIRDGVILFNNKKELVYKFTVRNIKNIRKELKIHNYNTGIEEDKYSFIKIK